METVRGHQLIHVDEKGREVQYGRVPYEVMPRPHTIIYYAQTSFMGLKEHREATASLCATLEEDSDSHGRQWRHFLSEILQPNETNPFERYTTLLSFSVTG